MQILDDSVEEASQIADQMEQIRRAYNLLRDDADPDLEEGTIE